MAARSSFPLSEPHKRPALEPVSPVETGGGGRVVVRFTRFCCQPLDPDNFVGSTKALLDCLRQAWPEIIADDGPEFIELQHAQIRVRTRKEEGTRVEVFRPAEAAGGGSE